ncbi:hypothetical protein ACMFMG_002632 [Clarireedia jacksonii]
MAAHLSNATAASHGNSSYAGTSLADLPKSWTFTTSLPADPKFPTPADSHNTPRDDITPRQVKGALFTWVRPEKAKDPELLAVSPAAMRDLGIKEGEEKTEEFKEVVAGNKILGWDEEKQEGGYPWAQCYGGWQFGSWAGQLGDGRAISLFETTNPNTNKRYELQLKGAGITPYSRFADGKAVLRSSIREFIVSEALHGLRIPTTRALSLTLLPHEKVRRETLEPGAIVARFAESWLRIGTFDIMQARGERGLIRQLSTYIAENVFDGWESLPGRIESDEGKTEEIKRGIPKDTIEGPAGREENRFTRLYREIVRRNARTVAEWQAYAFTNGVLNTDNTSIFGLSMDFGPFAFLDNFDPNYTPNHDDHMLRYSYRNQPTIIWWNLVRLGETFGELIGAGAGVDAEEFVEKGVQQEAADELIERAENLITRIGEEYRATFIDHYKVLMSARVGLRTFKEEDFDSLYSDLLDTMGALELDFNHFFRRLSSLSISSLATKEARKDAAKTFFHHEGVTGLGNDEESAKERIATWLEKWRGRIIEDWGEDDASKDEERMNEMKKVNPKFIPRGWVLDEIIKRVEKDGEREVLRRVMKMVEDPFRESWAEEGDKEAREEEERWCGDVPRLGRAMQCSCSSRQDG